MLAIRPATLADSLNIALANAALAWETEQLRLDPPTLDAGVRAVLQDAAKGLYFVAELNSRFAGQLMITWEWSDWRNGNIWWIQSVYVLPQYRRQGIFRTLYAHARTQAKSQKAAALRLYVEQHNAPAQKTYISLGMTQTPYRIMEDLL